MDDLKFIYFMHLSNHVQDDGNGKSYAWYPSETDYKPTNDIDFGVWDRTVQLAGKNGCNTLLIDVGDSVQYESHPEIAAPDALTKEQFKKKLDEARAAGMVPLPKLNFSTVHHCWLKEYRRMVGSDIYRKVAVDLIDEVCELFDNPELFHLGMDEEHSFDCLQWREIAIMRGEKVMFEDFGTMFDACRRNGARPWIWGDYYWNHPDAFVKNVSKDIMISNWFYGRFQDLPKSNWVYNAIHGYENFERLGYDQLPTCSTHTSASNPYETLAYCKDIIAPERLKGFLMAHWIQHVTAENEFRLIDSVYRFKDAMDRVFPELSK